MAKEVVGERAEACTTRCYAIGERRKQRVERSENDRTLKKRLRRRTAVERPMR